MSEATPGELGSNDRLGPLQPSAWMYARAYGSGLAFNLPPCDAGPDDEWHLNPQRLYALTSEDVAAVNKARARKVWMQRRTSLCRCDHNEYCEHCWPASFRPGGPWHGLGA